MSIKSFVLTIQMKPLRQLFVIQYFTKYNLVFFLNFYFGHFWDLQGSRKKNINHIFKLLETFIILPFLEGIIAQLFVSACNLFSKPFFGKMKTVEDIEAVVHGVYITVSRYFRAT